MARKTICVWIPSFRTAIETQRCPDWASKPLAIYAPRSKNRELVEVSSAAVGAGLATGLAFKEAQLRCPQGVYLPDDPDRYAQAFESVLAALDRFSPVVEAAGVGLAFMDAAGLEPLYGPDDRLCRRVRQELAASTGQQAQVGIARGRFAAEVAARSAVEAGFVPATPSDRAYLAEKPAGLLPLPEAALAQLCLLGVETVGEFAELPANSVRARYGPEGALARRLARGQDPTPLRGRDRPFVLDEAVEFEWEEDSLDRLAFALRALADRLARRLASHGLMAQRLRAEVIRAGGESRSFTLDLPEPSAQARTFRDAVRWYLDAAGAPAEGIDDPAPGVVAIKIQVSELVPFQAKALSLFANRAERLERANLAIGRLRVALGEKAVFRTDLHRENRIPEQAFYRLDPYLQEPRPELIARQPEERYAARSGGALRLFDPPLPARFSKGPQMTDGFEPLAGAVSAPAAKSQGDARPQALPGCRLEFNGVSHPVAAHYGPHRLQYGWWEKPVERDYFRVLLKGGDGLLVYRDLESGRWFVQGLTD